MNPLGVLTARDVMEPGDGDGQIDASAKVGEVMERLGEGGPLSVVEGGTVLGRVSHASVLAKLVNPRGA
jgi:glycine betaine/proline transport system ATP-binding protein